MTLPPLAVSQLTALELPPPALLEAAGAAGCRSAGVRLLPVLPGAPAYPLMDDAPLLRETLHAIAQTGVTVSDLEIVILRPETDPAGFEAFLDAGARIGAKHVLVVGYDEDEARLVDTFAAFCDRAAARGLTADLEFLPWSTIPDLTTATRIVRAAARPNAGILMDPLHFYRAPNRIEDIASVPRRWWHYWQICDGPAAHPGTVEGLLHTARAERLYPGEGGLDLVALIRAMPPDIVLSIEVPKDEMARSVPGAERVRRAADATRAYWARLPPG